MMRVNRVFAWATTLATAISVVVGTGPAQAAYAGNCDAAGRTPYGTIGPYVEWDPNIGETRYDLYVGGKPIRSESFVRAFYFDGSTHDLKYPTNNGGVGGRWHYANTNDHPAWKLEFHTYIGPAGDVYACGQTYYWD